MSSTTSEFVPRTALSYICSTLAMSPRSRW